MHVNGRYLCAKISFALSWEPDPQEIPARACSCLFYSKHAGALDVDALSDLQRQLGDRHIALLALTGSGVPAGVLTISESFAIYASGWRRIDVTAPETARGRGVRHFYEQNGFSYAGPKLKRLL